MVYVVYQTSGWMVLKHLFVLVFEKPEIVLPLIFNDLVANDLGIVNSTYSVIQPHLFWRIKIPSLKNITITFRTKKDIKDKPEINLSKSNRKNA